MINIQLILSSLLQQINDPSFIARHKTNPKAFLRNRKITPLDIVLFVLTLARDTLPSEIKRYFSSVEKPSVSPGSMTKARSKLSSEAFRELFLNITSMMPQKRNFKGYRLVAFDGMKGELIRTPEILEKYQPMKDSRIPMFHAISAYDVLNKFFLDAVFLPSPADEHEAAIDLINGQTFGERDILLFDRGFPSVRLIQLLNQKKINFVVRVSNSFLSEVNTFRKSDLTDEVITINYTKRRSKTSRVKCDAPLSLTFRAVKIQLSSGETEVLITSFSEFSIAELSELYALRWGIETSYNYLKNSIHVERFVGILENSVKQEFYSALLMSNITSLLYDEANVELYKKLKTGETS